MDPEFSIRNAACFLRYLLPITMLYNTQMTKYVYMYITSVQSHYCIASQTALVPSCQLQHMCGLRSCMVNLIYVLASVNLQSPVALLA